MQKNKESGEETHFHTAVHANGRAANPTMLFVENVLSWIFTYINKIILSSFKMIDKMQVVLKEDTPKPLDDAVSSQNVQILHTSP